MDLNAIREYFIGQLPSECVEVSEDSIRDGRLSIRVNSHENAYGVRMFELSTRGVEIFETTIDSQFGRLDAEYDPQDQRFLLTQLARVATTYLSHGARLVSSRRHWWLRPKDRLEVFVGGELWEYSRLKTPLRDGA
jgi:hypothetical protein